MPAQFGYKIVLDEPYPSTASDLTPVVMKIKNAKPDVLLLTSNAADAILLTNTMATMKVKVKAIIGTGGGHADPMFRKNTAKNCEYMFDVVEWETDLGRPEIPTLNAEFKKRNGYDLAGESVDAFASVYVIADALERAKSDRSRKRSGMHWLQPNYARVPRHRWASTSFHTPASRLTRQARTRKPASCWCSSAMSKAPWSA